MNNVFSFGDVQEIEDASIYEESQKLLYSVENINALPIREDQKELLIQQEIKLFNTRRNIDIQKVQHISELYLLPKLLFKEITLIVNVDFENIYHTNVISIYNALFTVIRYLKYKTNSLENNKNHIYYKDKVYTRKVNNIIDFEQLESNLRNVRPEIISIDNGSRDNISYQVVGSIFEMTKSVKAFLTEIYFSEPLSYEYFGKFKEEELKTLKNTLQQEKKDND